MTYDPPPMSAFEAGAFGGGGIGAVKPVAVDIYTAAYRVSGTIETRFSRVTEILNQQSRRPPDGDRRDGERARRSDRDRSPRRPRW